MVLSLPAKHAQCIGPQPHASVLSAEAASKVPPRLDLAKASQIADAAKAGDLQAMGMQAMR